MLDVDYILQNGDHIIHRVHRHEHPVLPKPIQIIENSDDLLVINKPASIPVHPCGKYKYNSITEMLKELGFSDLRGSKFLFSYFHHIFFLNFFFIFIFKFCELVGFFELR